MMRLIDSPVFISKSLDMTNAIKQMSKWFFFEVEYRSATNVALK
jgi:hypothetical protein